MVTIKLILFVAGFAAAMIAAQFVLTAAACWLFDCDWPEPHELPPDDFPPWI